MIHIEDKLKQLYPDGNWIISKSAIGASDQAFVASNGERKVFVKLIKSPALKRLAELGVAPPVIYDGSSENKPYIVQEFVEGVKPNKSWFAQNVNALALFIRKYHQDKVLKDILEKEEKLSYRENIERVLKGLDNDINASNSDLFNTPKVKELIKTLREKGEGLKPGPLVPTHTDPNPQNLLLTKKGIVMVDWDDIFLSDPFKDIGLILWWYIPRDKWSEFFEVYGMKLDEGKLRWWIARNTLSIAGWYGKQGNEEYVKFFIDDALLAFEGKDNSQIF